MKNEYLKNYLIDLIAKGRIEQFYHRSDWKALKKDVFKKQHFECQECLKDNILTIVDLECPCHHVKELKDFPELALSEIYIDELGNKQRNLLALCFKCHNKIHNRFQKKDTYFNEERW